MPHEYNIVVLTPRGIYISKPTSPPLEQCLTSDIEHGMGGKAVVMLLTIRSLQRRFPKTSRVQSPRLKAGVSACVRGKRASTKARKQETDRTCRLKVGVVPHDAVK